MTHLSTPNQRLSDALYTSTMPRSGGKGAIVADSVTEREKANRKMIWGFFMKPPNQFSKIAHKSFIAD
jgi:hypothetical protein